MRIGFRFDEIDRMFRFFNNSDPCNFSIPVSCKNYGEGKQVFANFNWRFCTMPLIKAAVVKPQVKSYWKQNGVVGGGIYLRKEEKFTFHQFQIV